MKLSKKLNSSEFEEYRTVCEIWCGGVPVDVTWAISTNAYKRYREEFVKQKIIKEEKNEL